MMISKKGLFDKDDDFMELILIRAMDKSLEKYPMSQYIASENNEHIILYKYGTPIGMLMFFYTNSDTIFLSKIYVVEAERGNGYGTKLFNRMKDIVGHVAMEICIHKDNKASKQFFDRFNPTHIAEYLTIPKL